MTTGGPESFGCSNEVGPNYDTNLQLPKIPPNSQKLPINVYSGAEPSIIRILVLHNFCI